MRRIDRRLGRRHDSAPPAAAQLRRLFDVVNTALPALRFRLPAVILLAAAVLFPSCRGPVQPYEALAPQVANLRAEFNKDAGKVRILILPAPT